MAKYCINFNKSSTANLIRWNSKLDIHKCKPFIDFIRCDDGSDYIFLTSEDNQIKTININNIEMVSSEIDNCFYVCLEANIEINLSKYSKFRNALINNDNFIEVSIGFELNKKILDCFEEVESKLIKLETI